MKTPKEWAAECLRRIGQQPSYGKQPSEIIEAVVTEALAEAQAKHGADMQRMVNGFRSHIADVIRCIGPARRPEDIKAELESMHDNYNAWADPGTMALVALVSLAERDAEIKFLWATLEAAKEERSHLLADLDVLRVASIPFALLFLYADEELSHIPLPERDALAVNAHGHREATYGQSRRLALLLGTPPSEGKT